MKQVSLIIGFATRWASMFATANMIASNRPPIASNRLSHSRQLHLPPNVYFISWIKLDGWPKNLNMTPSHSLLGQLYGPEYTLQTTWQSQKMAFFRWCDVTGPSVLFNTVTVHHLICRCSLDLRLRLNYLFAVCYNEAVWQQQDYIK